MESDPVGAGSSSSWPDEVEIVGSTVVPPDPTILTAIGLNYALEAAIADLVDNSIDAGARNVLIRFLQRGSRLVSLCVVDDGHGMDRDELEHAMALGRRRDYDAGDLGHFGLGLKAASLGKARSLIVVSRAAGAPACGRRWLTETAGSEFECDVVADRDAAMMISRSWGPLRIDTGTVIRWDKVTDFPRVDDLAATLSYIEKTLPRLRNHLGLVFHRLIADGSLRIQVDVEDLDTTETGPPQTVTAIDPFGYNRTGHPDYPRTLPVHLDTGSFNLTCHIWPPRSQLPAFRFPRSCSGEHRGQGFYFYRNDRLLQSGGWSGVTQTENHRQLARVAVDLGAIPSGHVTMNPEKTSIQASDAFVRAVERARDGNLDLPRYLDDATSTFRDARKRATTRARVIPPGRGFAPDVRHAIADELEFVGGVEGIEIRWQDFDDDSFLQVDRASGVIWLNRRYRWAVAGNRRGGLNDAPLLKAALYLLMNDLFQGEYFGAKKKDNVELWNAVLTAAVQVEAE